MAGTDKSRHTTFSGPTIILVEPQLGVNIGAAARAMLNFGLTDLRLVRPRDGWPSSSAVSAASGADLVLDKARVYDSVIDVVGDFHLLYASTARRRDILKPVFTPEHAAEEMLKSSVAGKNVAVLFGPERAGLNNTDVALTDAILSVPINPAYASLNLAQAVLLVAYEWFRATMETQDHTLTSNLIERANKRDLIGFFEHLESELDDSGFLLPLEKRPTMVRNIRALFHRANLMDQEVRTLRGIISALSGRKSAGSG